MAVQIQWRRGTSTEWTNANPVLAEGEPGMETDTGKWKFGDGVTAWNSLGYHGAAPSPHALGGAHHGADTLANLNAKVSDGTLADFRANTRANQPAAGVANRYYFVTDERVLERDTGTAWEQVVDLTHRNNTANPHSVTAAQAGAIAAPSSPSAGDELFWNGTEWVAGGRPVTRVERRAALSVANNTITVVPWDTEAYDTHNLWVSTSPGEITITESGIYVMTAQITWVPDSTGERYIDIHVGTTDPVKTLTSYRASAHGLYQEVLVSTTYQLLAGDTVRVNVRQTSGASLDTLGDLRDHLALAKLRSE